MRGLSGTLEQRGVVRRAWKLASRMLLAALMLLLYGFAGGELVRSQDARTASAEISAFVINGHGRLIFTFSEETKAEVQVSNGILIVGFRQPVAITLDQIQKKLPGYVNAGRRDPDGTAVRFSLARKVTVNIMEAGEKLFVDLLPESWTGLPPGLPQDVIDDLAKRAREAERLARVKRMIPAAEAPASAVRLRVSNAPTFARFAFEMPEPIAVALERDGQELRLQFQAPVKIDLGEARTQLPTGVVGLDVAFEEARSTVTLVLAPNAQVRDFREGRVFLVDVTPPPLGGAAPPAFDLAAAAEAHVTRSEEKAEAAVAAQAAAAADAALKAMPPFAEGAGPDAAPAPLDLTTGPGGVANSTLVPLVGRHAGQFSISFAFSDPVPAAVFARGESIWMVFDTPRAIDTSPLVNEPTRTVVSAEALRSESGAVLRLKLARTRLASAEREGNTWIVTLGDVVVEPSRPLPLRRAPGADERGAVLIPLETPGQIHRIADPDVGDSLLVVTAQPPARGILRGQNFVEFRVLPSIHGLAFVPFADDMSLTLIADGAILRRPSGLAVSDLPAAPPAPKKVEQQRKATPLDVEIWKAERAMPYHEREAVLIHSVASSPPGQRADARLMLARFYLAHGFASEAKGVLEAGMREDNLLLNRPPYFLLRGIAELSLGRPAAAVVEFTNPQLADVAESALLRGIALAEQGRWGPARDALRVGADAYPNLPVEFQRQVLLAAARSAIEVRDFVEASRIMNDLEVMEMPANLKPTFALLAARVAEGVGRFERAKSLYDTIAEVHMGPAGAEARLRSIAMRHARGELDRPKAIDRLQTLALMWRGDHIELETIRLLGRLYVAEARYRDAFKLLDAALLVDPEAESTHDFHTEMAAVFEDLFLTGKAETLPPVDALALYYDFSRLTPIGRRGDELIRRLADRLVSVDLLDQATELLDHQVQYRLSGAAKAQVAAKLAIVHLLNHKPTEAVRVLVGTRMPQLTNQLREERMFIEARALSETGRHEVAAELIENLQGPEADRLRADIAWAAKNWREAGERIEKLLGERWKTEAALNPAERHDVLRAALAFALGKEMIGLARLKEKYVPKMGETPEGKVLALLVTPEGTSAKTLADAAKALASFDSLGTFLKVYRERYPERPLPPDTTPTSGVTRKVTAR
jgi:tetratricopeptide (TPR) repeat protein